MKLAMVGAGYVGLVTSVCFAETGNHVICVDKDPARIDNLNKGVLPIYELGLDELCQHNVKAGRLTFTTDLTDAVQRSEIVFLAVGTPPREDGSADLTAVHAVADGIARAMDRPILIVVKSTVPVGTTAELKQRISARTSIPFEVANNPEFLKEGLAIDDFNKPDRVIVGVEKPEVADVLRELYGPFMRGGNPLIVTDLKTSELIKYVANSMLATKISFINEMANLCEVLGADIHLLRRGVCSDKRIGSEFMFPGIGYGGSCLPKDVPALVETARQHSFDCRLLKAVHQINLLQPTRMLDRIKAYLGGRLEGRKIAVWGVAYKSGTDDVRFSPSLAIVQALVKAGAKVQVHDPQAVPKARMELGDKVAFFDDSYACLDGADALLIGTDWREYRSPDFDRIKSSLKHPAIFDGRNVLEGARVRARGFAYFGVGI